MSTTSMNEPIAAQDLDAIGVLEVLARRDPVAQLALSEGRSFESRPVTDDEWSEVRKVMRWTTAGECFENCTRAVCRRPTQLEYVEGYVVPEGVSLPIHHAWLTVNGKVVDPTLRVDPLFEREMFPDLAIGEFPAGRRYLGVVVPTSQLRRAIDRTGRWGPILAA